MPRLGLTAERVVETAADLVDAEGTDALTLGAVAGRLNIKPPSLYAHVGGLEDLRNRVGVRAATALGDALAPAAVGLARGDALAAVGQAYRAWVLAHPGLYGLLEPIPQPSAAADRVLQLLLAVLRGYGLEGDEAIHAARTLRSALHGFVSLEAAGGFQFAVSPDASFAEMLALLDRGLASPRS